MSDTASNTRVAENTLLLYFCILSSMMVVLYTNHVVLNTLGVENFSIYNVVGGIVSMLSFFNSSMGTSTQRFLNYEMGQSNNEGLRNVFINAVNAHYLIDVVTVIGLETVGLWFVHNKLNIPVEQFDATVRVYHCSVLSLFVSIISTPYNAAIIANKQMGVYAYYSTIEVVLKLLIVYPLVVTPYSKLIVYGLLSLGVSLLMHVLYDVYCIRNFTECKCQWKWNVQLMKKMFFFSGWMLFGCISDMLSKQGMNMLINTFFDPVFNAARTVAIQMQVAISNFVINFMAAMRPQIIKSYSAGGYLHMYRLVFSPSKLSFYLLPVLTTPVLIYIGFILQWWLKQVPGYCALFTRLILTELLINSTYVPIAQINQAPREIRNCQMAVTIVFLATFILTYVLYKMRMPIYSAFVLLVVLAIVELFMKILILRRGDDFPARTYLVKTMLPLLPVSALSLVIPILIYNLVEASLLTFIANSVVGFLASALLMRILGLDETEKGFVTERVLSKAKENK